MAQQVRNLSVNTGEVRDVGLIPDLEDPLEEEKTTYSGILARRIPWTEEFGELKSIGSQ